MTEETRAASLDIAPGSVVWIIGHSDEENSLLDPVASGVEVVNDIEVDEDDDVLIEENEPAAAIVVVDDAISLADDLDEALPRVTAIDTVWVAMLRRSRGVDPAQVEEIVTDYGWSVGEHVDLDDAWTAIRVEQS